MSTDQKVESNVIQNCKIIPIENWMVLQPLSVDVQDSIILPDSRNGARAAGRSVLLVTKIGEGCKKVKVGDYVVTKPGTTTLMSFSVINDEYLLVREDEVAAVLRK